MSDDAFTILLVEDDDATRTFLADNLTADGYELLVTSSVDGARRLLEGQFPDLAVVDVGLPDGSGLELVRSVREADGATSRLDPTTPMIVLSGRAGELDRLRGFDRGADDYVVKPFSYAELRSRVAALLRRAQGRRVAGRLRVGGLLVDPPSRQVTLHGEVLALSQKEFSLLRVLASDPTRVWTKGELLRMVWGHHHAGTTRTLDSHVCRLRHKLGVAGERWVTNVWGVGYRLTEPPPQPAVEAASDGGRARRAAGEAASDAGRARRATVEAPGDGGRARRATVEAPGDGGRARRATVEAPGDGGRARRAAGGALRPASARCAIVLDAA